MAKSPYLNEDGTFKGGFDGCVKHMMNIEGHDRESAEKICAFIGRRAGKIPNRNGGSLPLGNRAADGSFELPADGFYHLVPRGEYAHHSGVTQVLDDRALAEMVSQFERARRDPAFPGLLVDFDHFSDDPTKPSEAAGWVYELENREDGLWGRIRWTDVGEAAVRGGRYRLVSPVFSRSSAESLGNSRLRPLSVLKFAVTNSPNLIGMRPLSNRQETISASRAGAPADHLTGPQQQNTKRMTELMNRLGLPPDASPESALAAVARLQSSAAEAAALKNRVEQLESENSALREAQVQADLENYKDCYKPEDREKIRALLLKNRADTIALFDQFREQIAKMRKPSEPLFNRSAVRDPESQPGGADDPAMLARKQHEAVEEFRLANRCSYAEARNLVRLRKPELFGIKSS